jgi:benzoyl-CoA reductase/2-hydroxyglutaryl-CoA dehydratase subunit BcrC/BadD/HgdB
MEVLLTSPWIPPEWIAAHGFQPRGAWCAEDFNLQSLPLSAGVCAFSEAVVHHARTHTDCAVVLTTTCDQMRRSHDMLAVSSLTRVFLFNIPAAWQSPVAHRMFQAELERLGRFLQEMGGRIQPPEDLARLAEERGRARQMLIDAAPSCSARQFAGAVASYHRNGTADLPSPAATSPGAIPVALVGGPMTRGHWGLLDAIEAGGGRIVLNATEFGERSLTPAMPPGLFSADPSGTAARHGLDHCVDVFQRPNTRLYDWLRGRMTALGVRGIVLWTHVGCDLWRAEAQHLRECFGLPLVHVDADELDTCSPRTLGRIQAFLEMLQ